MSSEESQFNVQGYNIVTILKRLEAATSRLEDITIFQEETLKQQDNDKNVEGSSTKAIGAAGAGVSAVGSGVSATPKAIEGASVSSASEPETITAFNSFLTQNVTPFVTISKDIDPLIGQGASLLAEAFASQKSFLQLVLKAKKPSLDDPELLKVLTPINEKVGKLVELKDANRRSEYFNHLNTLAEGAPVLSWIVTDTPVSVIPDFKDSAKFWSDRVLKEYKEKDPKHAEWVKQFLNIFEELKAYVKKYHFKGPAWNSAGKSLSEVVSEQSSGAAVPPPPPAPGAAGGAPPPPPPPPPPPASLFEDDKKPEGGLNAVFADLNKGEAITAGLRKVDKSQMTHKNPALRQQAPLESSKKPSPPKKPASLSTNSVVKKKVAKKELVDGTKWIIQNYSKSDIPSGEPLILEVEMHQSVFIGNSDGITVQLKGKANAVSISESSNIGVVLDNLISGVDAIKSFKVGIQVLGVVPLISVDKSDEVNIYLSKESVEAETQIFTSSTTALNVNVPTDGDYEEFAAPEQFQHVVKGGKLVSEVVEHKG
ncbi:adenylate cyclase-associated protein [Scheffersomyces amazonensis]|uniref:adenylate cyclase-associated protein n=1 Tax=Scheffersomyces amazonensis TaxID=1078765 RepID=UPI00315DC7DC